MQQIHINRLGVNSIEFDIPSVEVSLSPGGEQSFEIVIINYGSPTHVNFSISENLDGYVTFLDDNPYVTHEEYVPVVVRIPHEGRVFSSGTIFVTMGYGSKTESFGINIGQKDNIRIPVEEEPKIEPVHNPSPPSSASKTKWSMDFGQFLKKSITPNDMKLVILLFFLIGFLFGAYYVISSVNLNPAGFSTSFYTSLAIAILLTLLFVYMLTKLPVFRK
ncbi:MULTISPECIES: DUF7524 family protein [Methanohalophilus]|uniref:Uncharacterized protein n=1 Tax=Methanohalophilus euhalobius TaxID=51203 RepID=A0A314ZZK2_9EURY|nr:MULTISPECIES: hypothetical protein [Methanohalophilus]KXS46245.1 MAG: hypothetical protein AWU58_715 [Methanohalophilus sp. T328-1]OBZ35529.1 MAG: hypothetical protein A9957_00190 [Methanohalophilus sp. DAL1]PQV42115.1 hypothetical protein B0H22_10953 [Methanohalophilus euhalobius]RNI12309.1 hypothetical protein EDD83_01770 [Methanohalophilus euhalobius]